MRIALVTSSVSRRAGGLFFTVRRLAQTLVLSGGAEVEVLGIADAQTPNDLPEWGVTTPQVFRRHGPAAFGYAPGMARSLARSECALAHTQGLWMYPSRAVYRWARAHRQPYMVTAHGMLDPWAVRNSGWKKRLAGWAYEHAHLRGAACLHALCDAEAQAMRGYGLRAPICVIPNGVDLPEAPRAHSPAWAAALPAGARVLLYLGRLHPKKGLPGLLKAWEGVRAAAQAGEWHLVIAGWDQGEHQAELATRIEHAGLQGQVHLVGPQFGADKAASYDRADAFILPSFSEGLPMTVLEAWAHSLPVLMTPACNLPEGFAAGAALEMAAEPDSIAAALRQLFGMPDTERQATGERGRQLVAERFTWPRVAEQMLEVYRWVLGQGPMPDSVILS